MTQPLTLDEARAEADCIENEYLGHRMTSLAATLRAYADQAEELAKLREALDGIYIYANDTLSGRADGGPDDREWQRAAVVEIRNRAREFASVPGAVNARLRALVEGKG